MQFSVHHHCYKNQLSSASQLSVPAIHLERPQSHQHNEIDEIDTVHCAEELSFTASQHTQMPHQVRLCHILTILISFLILPITNILTAAEQLLLCCPVPVSHAIVGCLELGIYHDQFFQITVKQLIGHLVRCYRKILIKYTVTGTVQVSSGISMELTQTMIVLLTTENPAMLKHF